MALRAQAVVSAPAMAMFWLSPRRRSGHFLSVLGIGYSGTTRGGGPGGYPPNSTLLR
jgi:hypothetical protein